MIDLAVDSTETAQALGKLVDGIISAADDGIEDHKRNYGKAVSALQVKTGYTDEKFLNPTALAKEMGVEEQVLLCHKLCSKLVHPTAQSILSIDLERLQEGQHQRDVQFLFGADQLGELLRDLIPLARDLIEQESALSA